MENIPKDPIIFMSWANTKLRDFYPSLDALCEDMELDAKEVAEKLLSFGFKYDKETNRIR